MKLGEIAPLDLAVGAVIAAGVGAIAFGGFVLWLGYRVRNSMNPCGRAILDGMKPSDAIFMHPRVLAKLRANGISTEFHTREVLNIESTDPNFDARAWVIALQQRVCIFYKEHRLRSILMNSGIDFHNREDVDNASAMFTQLDNYAVANNGKYSTIEEMIDGPEADLFKPEGELL